jgi:hypothetical protein
MLTLTANRIATIAVALTLAATTLIVLTRTNAPDAVWMARAGTAPLLTPADAAVVQEASGHAMPVAALVIALVVVVGRASGWRMVPAVSTALTVLFSGVFWSLAVSAQPAIDRAALTMAAIAAQWWWIQSRRRGALACVAMTGGLVVAAWWWPWRSLGSVSLWWVHDGGQLVDRLRELGRGAATDLGALGLLYVAIGAVVLARHRPRLLALCGAWMCVAMAWGAGLAPNDGVGAQALVLVPIWLVLGAGMNGIFAGGRVYAPAAVMLVMWLPIVSAIGHFPAAAAARATTLFAARSLDQLQAVLPSPVTVVAEGGTLDEQIVARTRSDAAFAWRRIAQDPAAIRRALAAGEPVVSLAGARANLEALGFQFAAVPSAGVPVTLTEYLQSIPDGWIVAAAAGDRFALSVPPRAGPTFGAVGGRVDLFAATRPLPHYAIIGVRGGRDVASESSDRSSVRLDVAAGDDLTSSVRAPASLIASSDEHGATVRFNGTEVAHTATGLALALVSPSGELVEAVGVEFDNGLRMSLTSRAVAPASLIGSQPCADVAAGGRWADVSAPAQLAALGGLVDGPADLLIYARSDHELVPHPRPLRHRAVPQIRVDALGAVDATDRAAVLARVTADELTEPARWLESPYLYRIAVASASAGRRQLALDLGGFATEAVARLTGASSAGTTLCAATRNNTPTPAARAWSAEGEIDLDSRDLFVFGWDRVEGRGPGRMRWTRAVQTEMLIPVVEPAPMVLELDVAPPAEGSDLRVTVNGTSLAPVRLALGTHRYRWTLVASALERGMNRVVIGTSKLVRPMDVGPSDDDRRLGVAVHRIVLAPLPPVTR